MIEECEGEILEMRAISSRSNSGNTKQLEEDRAKALKELESIKKQYEEAKKEIRKFHLPYIFDVSKFNTFPIF